MSTLTPTSTSKSKSTSTSTTLASTMTSTCGNVSGESRNGLCEANLVESAKLPVSGRLPPPGAWQRRPVEANRFVSDSGLSRVCCLATGGWTPHTHFGSPHNAEGIEPRSHQYCRGVDASTPRQDSLGVWPGFDQSAQSPVYLAGQFSTPTGSFMAPPTSHFLPGPPTTCQSVVASPMPNPDGPPTQSGLQRLPAVPFHMDRHTSAGTLVGYSTSGPLPPVQPASTLGNNVTGWSTAGEFAAATAAAAAAVSNVVNVANVSNVVNVANVANVANVTNVANVANVANMTNANNVDSRLTGSDMAKGEASTGSVDKSPCATSPGRVDALFTFGAGFSPATAAHMLRMTSLAGKLRNKTRGFSGRIVHKKWFPPGSFIVSGRLGDLEQGFLIKLFGNCKYEENKGFEEASEIRWL
ncbi:unnamed protein product [Protopolystoma xenopodis]|uniref:Uncharacterized protein n=1 Tax=Protopolystoma xenopodis TaxID=117903 RepID=A0A3S5CUH6_9PLAT|nr:unnamed protein product [Protopolystoma xenopodis]